MSESLETPKISVIIPTWNRALSVKRAITSALRQTCQPYEILICDDGSTDDTEEVVRAIGDSRIRWVAGAHAGCPAVPRNRGITASRGEWIAFLDSDDVWLPEKLEVQLAVVQKTGASAVCTNAFRDTGGGEVDGALISWSRDKLSFSDLVRDNKVVCSSMLVRRSLLDETSGFPERSALRIGEDFSLWLRVARLAPIAYIDEPLILYKDEPTTSVRAQGPSVATQHRRAFLDFLFWRAEKQLLQVPLDALVIVAVVFCCALEKRYYDCRASFGLLRRKLAGQLRTPEDAQLVPNEGGQPAEIEGSPPVVSVLLPVHNASAYVRCAIDSILRQTYRNFELIVIDDASTDGSCAVLDDLDDPRIVRLTFKKNQGIVSALNAALSKARGRYIARMDADDIATRNRFQLQVDYLDQHPDVAVVGSWIKGFGEVRREYVHRYPVNHAEIQACLLFESPFAHPTVMMRRSILDSLGQAYSACYPYTEDWELWSRLISVGGGANIPLPLLRYRIHLKSSSQRFTALQNDSKQRLLQLTYSVSGLPFRSEFVLGKPKSSPHWLSACFRYYKELLQAAEVSGRFERDVFSAVLQNQLTLRVRQMAWFGVYPAWFVFRNNLVESSIFGRLVTSLKILIITNTRFLFDMTLSRKCC